MNDSNKSSQWLGTILEGASKGEPQGSEVLLLGLNSQTVQKKQV